MFWLSRISEHSSYAGGLLGPMLVTGAGLGMLSMPLTLVAMNRVDERDAGLASSLRNVGQQVGGSIGLALLGTVAWTVVANTARKSAAAAAAAAKAGHPLAGTAAQVKAAIYDHALSVGFARGFEVSAGIMLIALIMTIAAIRVKRADLAGAQTTRGQPGQGRSERRDGRGRVTAERGPARCRRGSRTHRHCVREPLRQPGPVPPDSRSGPSSSRPKIPAWAPYTGHRTDACEFLPQRQAEGALSVADPCVATAGQRWINMQTGMVCCRRTRRAGRRRGGDQRAYQR